MPAAAKGAAFAMPPCAVLAGPMSGFPMPFPNETDFCDVNDRPISVSAIWNLKAAALALSMVGA